MPKFPEFDPELTCGHALNMILASIAMEELAFSHIINAEGEKLQYILGTLETSSDWKPCPEEVLAVNQSVTRLLDSVAQNQLILKNKMDIALHALSTVCPGRAGPPGPPGPPGPQGSPGPACKCPCKCSATFKASEKCRIWCPDSALHWDKAQLHGNCVRCNPCDKTKIELCSKGRFMIHFSVNVESNSDCKCNAAISLQAISNHRRTDLYTAHNQVYADSKVTMSICGVIIDTSDYYAPDSLILKLVSSDALKVDGSMLSITEI